MAVSGGAINPITYGLLTSGLTYAGKKVGEGFADDMPTDLKYYQEEANEALEQVTGGGLTNAIMAGLTAGVGQKLKLMKEAHKTAELTNVAATTNKAILAGVDSGSTDALITNTGKIADVTGDKAVNILDIVASITPKDGGVKAKDLYKSSKFLSLGNEGARSPIMDTLTFIKSLHTNRKKD